jgi:hypothetical protein
MLYSFFQVEKYLGANRSLLLTERVDLHSRLSSSAGVKKMGYVLKFGGDKSGGKGNWRRRFMVLEDDLYYYENEAAYLGNNPPKGKINLNLFHAVSRDHDSHNSSPDETNANNNQQNEFEFVVLAIPNVLRCRYNIIC